MRRARLAWLGCLAALGPPAGAAGFGGTIGLVSDQVYRGISVTAGRAAALTELNYGTDTGWSASLASSWADVDAPARVAQLSVGAGHAWQLDPASTLQLNYLHRAYPGASRSRYYGHYDEFGASIDWQGRWFAGLTFAPRVSIPAGPGEPQRAPAQYYELGYRQRLHGRVALDLGLGYADIHATPDRGYAYGSIGLGGGIGPVQASLTWITSRAADKGLAPASLAGRRWVAAAIWAF